MTTRWMRFLGVALVAVAGWGCSESTAPEENRADALVPSPHEVILRLDEEKTVGASTVHVHFIRVEEDSRCPVDELVRCIWEGRGVVSVGVWAGTGPRYALTLETRAIGSTTRWNGLRITLLELTPAATWNPPTDPGAYAVRLLVEPDGR